MPQNLLTNEMSEVSTEFAMGDNGPEVKFAITTTTGGDMKSMWANKWSAENDRVARELAEDQQQAMATETLADSMYLDFFGGTDPFGVTGEGSEVGGEEEAAAKPRQRGHKKGKGSLARQPTHAGALSL